MASPTRVASSHHQVLEEVLQQVGLEPHQLETALSDLRYEAEVDEDIAQACEFGLEGVPALVFNNNYLITGAQPYAMFARGRADSGRVLLSA
ncbi:MAG: hypothetical protein HC853_18060 [Anaerolineae bacterium]|nr:hypothetical protein [Anaerolineae bacterium]